MVQSDGGQCEQLWPVLASAVVAGCANVAEFEWSIPVMGDEEWARQ